METRPGAPQNRGNGLVLDRHGRNGIMLIGRGLAYRKTEETDFSWTSYGRNGVLLIGRGVAYRKKEETDLCWSTYGRNGVLFIGRGLAFRKIGLPGLLFIYCLWLHSVITTVNYKMQTFYRNDETIHLIWSRTAFLPTSGFSLVPKNLSK